MVKLTWITIAIFLIACQQQRCTAYIGVISNVLGICQFINDVGKELFFEEIESVDKTYLLSRNIKEDMIYEFGQLMKTLTNLENNFPQLLKKRELERNIDRIARIFEEGMVLYLNTKNGTTYTLARYREYLNNGKDIDDDIRNIRNILLSQNAADDLIRAFTTKSEIYDNACRTGMSQLQFLDNYLHVLNVVTAQYFISRTLMYDLVDTKRMKLKKKRNYDQPKIDLKNLVKNNYKEDLAIFKRAMENASHELWTCDSGVHTDSPYYELQAFQKYIIDTNDFTDRQDITTCSHFITLNDCKSSPFCLKQRLCSRELVNCKNMYNPTVIENNVSSNTYICMSPNPTSIVRYQSIVSAKEKQDKFLCLEGDEVRLSAPSKVTVGHYIPVTAAYLNHCDCICPEKQYYISHYPVVSNVSDNKVVTGAKFTVRDNTFHIQIQEGKILANGSIDPKLVAWKPIDENSARYVLPITWDGIREIDLSGIVFNSNDYVITGLKFEQRNMRSRMSLGVYATIFDFRSGNLSGQVNSLFELFLPKLAKTEFKLTNRDVPTRSRRPNKPDFEDTFKNKFLKFTISSSEKDGGQTTIPFIDTQEIKTNPTIPLSGVHLVHSRQVGYGGFLALKLYTYNMFDYVEDVSEIKPFSIKF